MAKKYKLIEVEESKNLVTIWLNRPEKHNAFEEMMLIELIDAIEYVDNLEGNILVLLRGRGPSFCAGADISWLKGGNASDNEIYYEESVLLGRTLKTISTSSRMIVAVVHGSVYGGGIGLMSACDYVLVDQSARFCFSELKLGLVPAMISPYVYTRIGYTNSLDLMLTTRIFDADQALDIKLINKVEATENLETVLAELSDVILAGGPMARGELKKLLSGLNSGAIGLHDYEKLACILSELRLSDEAIEGMDAFLNKRKPNWRK